MIISFFLLYIHKHTHPYDYIRRLLLLLLYTERFNLRVICLNFFFSPRQPSSPPHSHRLLWLGLIKATKIITKFNHSHSSVFFFLFVTQFRFRVCSFNRFSHLDIFVFCFRLREHGLYSKFGSFLQAKYTTGFVLPPVVRRRIEMWKFIKFDRKLLKNIFLNFSYSLGFLRSLKNSLTLS